ncbi:MAG TPA: hypothetical protein VFA65_10715 [Bryobacteraceae bacterium]|nr:hypothetical protein [Bryobacteraceae bacterium]
MASGVKVVFFGLVLALNGVAREEFVRYFVKTVDLRQGQSLLVEHKLGDIVISTHPQRDLTISAQIHVSAPDRARAEQFANRIEIVTDPSASVFSIRTRYPEKPDSFFGFNNVSYWVRYELTIPENTPLEVRNSFGGVSVSGLKANGDIRTSHGVISFRAGKGIERLENSFANIEVIDNAGDVAIENTNGNVKVQDVTGALNIKDRFGSISAERIGNGVTITNTNGPVSVSDATGAGRITNAFGDVTVRNLRGDLTVHNGNGRIDASNVNGMAELNTSFAEVRFSEIGHALSVRANNSQIQGTKVKGSTTIENSFGRVLVADVDGGVNVQSRNGEVSVSRIRGAATLTTSFAPVEASDVAGVLTVDNANGGVKAADAQSAKVKTSFGAVVLEHIAGAIEVDDQNGAVDASGNTQGGCQPVAIRTSFSPIRLHLTGNPSYRVSATTSFGKISSDFPMSVSGVFSANTLNGIIGDGRCDLRLVNRNGSIEILNSRAH